MPTPQPDLARQAAALSAANAVPTEPLTRSSARSVRYAVLTVQAPVKPRTTDRAPIDVAFVLDRSKSMSGQKMVVARDAVLQGLGMLHPEDRFTVRKP